MSGDKRSLGVLMSYLESEGLVDAPSKARGESRLRESRGRGTHWSIQLLMGAGAWLAAVLLLGFAFAGFNLYRHPDAYVPLGLLLVGGAAALRTGGENPFLAQLTLAFSLAGQALAICGAGHAAKLDGVFGMSALLCGVLQVIYPDAVHRGLSWAVALYTGTCWVANGSVQLVHIPVLGMALMVTMWATSDRPSASLRPAAYVCAAGLPMLLFAMCFQHGPHRAAISDIPSRIMLAVLLWQMVGWAARDLDVKPEPLALARFAVALLACVGSAGLLAAGLLLVIGFDRQDKVLLALGGCALPLFLWAFYYDLRLTLAVKSAALIASGLTLLAGRMVLIARPWAHGGAR